jgi:hypothetical protein
MHRILTETHAISRGSDDGIKQSESLDFWILITVWNSTWLENTTFRKLHLFQPSGEGREGDTYTPILLDPLESANITRSPCIHMTTESDRVSETSVY